MDANAFGVRLRELRKSAGLTQHELAEKSGVTRSAIAKFELGKREPLLATAQRLASALGVDCTAFQEAPEPSPAAGKSAKPAAKGKRKKGKGA